MSYFITLEGGDGSGKSTLGQALVDQLKALTIPVLWTREPGGSEGAELIRSLLVTGNHDRWDGLTEYLLLSAARRDHIIKTIQPALRSGQWVVCDRFFDSSLAYQGGGHGLDQDLLLSIFNGISEGLMPFKTFLLDIDPTLGLARTQKRHHHEVRYEALPMAFHERVRAAFLDLATNNTRYCVLDACQPPSVLLTKVMDELACVLPS